MTLEEIEKRLRELEDLEEIKKLHRQYIFWVNSRNWDDIVNSFTEDGWVHIQGRELHQGKKQLKKLFSVDIAKTNDETHGCHFVMQPVISVDGDKATGHWFMCIVFAISTPNGPTLAWRQGRHDCEYVKVNGTWKFKSVKYTKTGSPQTNGGEVFH